MQLSITNPTLATDAIRIIERFIINVLGLRYLSQKVVSDPFGMTISLNFSRVAALNWCKLFGADSEDHHWKKIIDQKCHDNFRNHLSNNLGITLADFEVIRGRIKCFRDEYTSHREQYPTTIPYFIHPLNACEVLYNIIKPEECFAILVENTRKKAELQLRCLVVR